METPQGVDVNFHVPAVHRLRFTQDVFGDDWTVLSDLLVGTEGQEARVQVWFDQDVADGQPGLVETIQQKINASDKLTMAGNVQFVPGGEQVKNDIHIIERMLKVFNAADLDRRSYVVVIGGGAVLDAVGFAVAIAHRGLRLVRIPTTTLAQADSGVGVKNSVNLFEKKNWIGTFATPWAVVNDAAMLKTLSDRDFVCGFSEAVKVALLKDAKLFGALCDQAEAVRQRSEEVTGPLIRQSAMWHLHHITRGGDPFEVREARPLDYGHWSAHKLEVMADFEIRHGEAVAMGVAIDTVYSSAVHGLPAEQVDRVLHCLADMGMPLTHPLLHETERLFDGLEEFRQHLGGRLTLTMLQEVGQPIEVHEVDRAEMIKAIELVAQWAADHATIKTA